MTRLTDDLLFANDEWIVTPAGLDHRRTGYFIDAGQVGERRPDGLWSWPIHMAEKSWCAPEPFFEAFMHALALYGLRPDSDLARSFAAAGGRTTHQAVWDHVAHEIVGQERQGSPLSLGEVMAISGEMGRRTGLGGPGLTGNMSGSRAAEGPARGGAAARRRAGRQADRLSRAAAWILEWLRGGGYRPEGERAS